MSDKFITCDDHTVSLIRDRVKQTKLFLQHYKWIMDAYVSDFFVCNFWHNLPHTWTQYLQTLDPPDISFLLCPGVQTHRGVPPLSLLSYRQCALSLAADRRPLNLEDEEEDHVQDVLNRLTGVMETQPANQNHCNGSVPSSDGSPGSRARCHGDRSEWRGVMKNGQWMELDHMYRKHVKPKKQHEIQKLSQIISRVCREIQSSHVVDVGAGLGHLSRILTFGHGVKVTTVEAAGGHAPKAERFDREIKKEIVKAEMKKQKIDQSEELVEGVSPNMDLPSHVVRRIHPNISTQDFLSIILQSRRQQELEQTACGGHLDCISTSLERNDICCEKSKPLCSIKPNSGKSLPKCSSTSNKREQLLKISNINCNDKNISTGVGKRVERPSHLLSGTVNRSLHCGENVKQNDEGGEVLFEDWNNPEGEVECEDQGCEESAVKCKDQNHVEGEVLSEDQIEREGDHESQARVGSEVACEEGEVLTEDQIEREGEHESQAHVGSEVACEEGEIISEDQGCVEGEVACEEGEVLSEDQGCVEGEVACEDQDSKFVLTGLHACGDLTSTVIRMFVNCEAVSALALVGCCYMKLSQHGSLTDEDSSHGAGYPMSKFVQMMSDCCLTYSARELACHFVDNYIQRLNAAPPHLKIHGYRAALQHVITALLPGFENGTVKLTIRNAVSKPFESYASSAMKKIGYSSKIPMELLQEAESYLPLWKNVMIFYTLRLCLAPVVETLILLDRMLFLYENGISSVLVPVFDPQLSPRSFVLLATKTLQVT